jgi:uncharacterized protein
MESTTHSRAMERAERNIHIDYRFIADFCERHGIHSLTLFGSVLRDDFHDESDIDILVTFEGGSKIDLFTRIDMALELEDHFGRNVDFRPPSELSPYIRDKILAEAVEFYVR